MSSPPQGKAERWGEVTLVILLAVLGLAIFLGPAIVGPVVKWSDSEIDLSWARRGIGIFAPAPLDEQLAAGNHVTKPLYLLFLRSVTAVAPKGSEARTVVILQSLLLLAAILWVSYAARRRGLVLCLLLLLLLRLRDAGSAIMPEALTAAMLITIGGGTSHGPRHVEWRRCARCWSRDSVLGSAKRGCDCVDPRRRALPSGSSTRRRAAHAGRFLARLSTLGHRDAIQIADSAVEGARLLTSHRQR